MAKYGTVEYYEEMLAEARRTADRRREAEALGSLGNLCPSHAIEYHQQSLEISRELGDEEGMCAQYKNLGAAYDVLRNDPYSALQMYQSCLAHTQNLVLREEIRRRIVRQCHI